MVSRVGGSGPVIPPSDPRVRAIANTLTSILTDYIDLLSHLNLNDASQLQTVAQRTGELYQRAKEAEVC